MSDGLDVDLELVAEELDDIDRSAENLAEGLQDTATGLTGLEARAQALAERVGAESGPLQAGGSWDILTGFGSAGVSGLLDRDEARAIERRYVEGFRMRTSLDRYDVMAGISAGIIATGVDWLVVRLPNRTAWQGELQSGSSLTRWFRGFAQNSDNFFAEYAKAGFDQVVGTGVSGMGPMTHRVQTFGHDPLLGLVMGTTDIMRGTLTAASKTGEVFVQASALPPVDNPAVALGIEVLHLLSDVVTTAGLPLPGWAALMTIPSVGGVEVAKLARMMYLRGYDTWHFLTMATSVAAVEAVCRGYFGIRSAVDEDYQERVDQEAVAAGSRRVSDHPRYQAISLIGHAVATGGNVARVLAAEGNPLAINYAQWLKFATVVTRAVGVQSKPADPGGPSMANRLALDTGWARLEFDVNRLGRAYG